MNNVPWLDILKMLLPNLKTVKGFSKALAKAIVMFILKWSGPQGWITSIILSRAIKFGLIEGKEFIQKIKDNHTISDGDYLETLPATDKIKRKRKENLKKLLEG